VKFLSVLVLGLVMIGCRATDQAAQKKLLEGKQALDQKQFDTAISKADAVLQSQSDKVSSAGAYYLRGRAQWQRPKETQAAWTEDLQQAKVNYNRALQLAPPPALEGYIRVSLASVLFHEGDYAAAFEEYSRSYDKVREPEIKSGILFRIGVCQQRLGRFEHADKTFAMLQQQFPGSYEAPRARERQGVRGFTLQLATFGSLKGADAAVAELRNQGVMAVKSTDPRGLTMVRVAPLSYQDAVALKQRFAGKYPDAIIIP
jgi:tetratricopeptide (TPR) repeat protein